MAAGTGAATTATSYTELANHLNGYVPAFLPEQLSLVNSGVFAVDRSANFPVGGAEFIVRKHTRDVSDWRTPVAATDSVIDGITAANEKGVIFRRYKALGDEDFSRLSSGDFNAMEDIARIHTHNAGYNTENQGWGLLAGLFGTGGPFTSGATIDLTVEHSSNGMSAAFISEAKKKMGENTGGFEFLFMHSNVYYGSEIEALTTPDLNETLMAEFQNSGMTYAGKYGGFKVILNDRVYKTGVAGTYDSYLFKRGAALLSYQNPGLVFRAFRDERSAAGTDVLQYNIAASMHVPGTTWTGATPSGLGGVTDAALATGSNWGTRTGLTVAECGIVCIKTIAS